MASTAAISSSLPVSESPSPVHLKWEKPGTDHRFDEIVVCPRFSSAVEFAAALAATACLAHVRKWGYPRAELRGLR
jgi:hypothetical protein